MPSKLPGDLKEIAMKKQQNLILKLNCFEQWEDMSCSLEKRLNNIISPNLITVLKQHQL